MQGVTEIGREKKLIARQIQYRIYKEIPNMKEIQNVLTLIITLNLFVLSAI